MFGFMKKPSRLGQWDGRLRSSREDEAVLPRLRRRSTLLRLCMVLSTAVAATVFIYLWGPILPYRVGEHLSHDLRVRVYFEVVDEPQTEFRREQAVEHYLTVERGDPLAREAIRRRVPPVVEKFPPGMPLVKRGEPINKHQLALLEEENRAYLRSLSPADHVRRGVALFMIMSLLAGVIALYGARFQRALAQSIRKTAGVCLLALITLALAMFLSRSPWHASLIPLTIMAMVFTLAYNPQFALLMSFSVALATTVAIGAGVRYLLVAMGGLATAVLLLDEVRTRRGLVKVAIGAGAAYLAMTVATDLLTAQPWSLLGFEACRHLAWGSLAGFILSGSLPLVERAFGIVTDISLLELADGSHPLLQELVRRAPGTHTHSMTVANLAEAAAEVIGANPLLARVGCYFHDVGKMLKPHYFIENQSGENRHDSLEPALSALIIIGHVKDGLALARQYSLPRPIIDFIQEHHGTTLVEYFYHEAIRQYPASGDQARNDLESSFRYPGPKPKSRETGIAMLADTVESASRALGDPTSGSLQKLVHDILMKRLLDGQFEESGLTLTELHQIEKILSKGLIAHYHSRVKYPDAKSRNVAS
jgi:putative nucleotidyltransferase with HDIG domain